MTASPRRRSRCLRRRGSVALAAAILLPVLVLFALLVLDYSFRIVVRQQAATAADAAALAACARVEHGDTRAAADLLVAANSTSGGPPAVASFRLGRWVPEIGTLRQDLAWPDACEVSVVVRAVSGIGLDLPVPSDVHATSTARYGHAPYDAVVASGLAVADGAYLRTPDGNLQIGSGGSCDLSVVGPATRVDAGLTSVLGGWCVDSTDSVVGRLEEATSPAVDPLADWVEPDPSTMVARGSIVEPGTYLPGRYDSVVLDGGIAVLRPGWYSLGSLSLSGAAQLDGSAGASLYLPPGCRAEVQNTAVLLAADVFQSRSSALPFLVEHRSSVRLSGTYYGVLAKFQMSGVGHRSFDRIVAGSVTIRDAGLVEVGLDRPRSPFLVK